MSFAEGAKRRLKNLKLDRVDLVAAGANPESHVMLFKHTLESADTGGTLPDNLSKDGNMSDTGKDAEQVEKDDVVTETVDVVEKAEPVAVTKAEHEAIAKQLDEAQAEIAKMRDEQRGREFVELAKSELPNLPVAADKLGGLLLKASDALGEDFSELLKLLKAADAQNDTAKLFKQLSDGNEPEAESFGDRLEKAAKALVEKGDAPTIEQAQSLAMKRNPELRKAYAAERK